MAPIVDQNVLLERPPISFVGADFHGRFAGSSVLVTGAGGSIAADLIDLLIDHGAATLVCVDSHEPSLFRLGQRLKEREQAGRVVLRLGDVRQTERMTRLMREWRVDGVFHLAAYKQVPLAEENCDEVVSVNTLASIDLADAAAACGARDFVYPSTDKAVRPPSLYGATKRIAEIELMRRNRPGSHHTNGIARLVNVFGTAGNVIETFSRRLVAGTDLPLTDPGMVRYWITNREAAGLLASCACLEVRDGPFLLETGDPVPITRTIERLAAALGVSDPRVRVVGARPGERLEEELRYPTERPTKTGVEGVVRAVDGAPLPDVRPAVAALGRAVAAGDEVAARRVLIEAVDARIAV